MQTRFSTSDTQACCKSGRGEYAWAGRSGVAIDVKKEIACFYKCAGNVFATHTRTKIELLCLLKEEGGGITALF
jgi:hypothetical protein